MGDAGLSIGGIGNIGFGIALTTGIGSVAAAQSPAAASITETPSSSTPSVVVTISDTALQALALDAAATTASANAAMSSRLLDDLVAATLLAILERDQEQDTPAARHLLIAAAAINAYLAAQALSGN